MEVLLPRDSDPLSTALRSLAEMVAGLEKSSIRSKISSEYCSNCWKLSKAAMQPVLWNVSTTLGCSTTESKNEIYNEILRENRSLTDKD